MKDRIKKIRKDAGLNQTEFGARLGVNQSTIAGYESGNNPPGSIIVLLKEKFNVNEEWLINGTGEPYVPQTQNQQIASFMNSVMEDVDESVKKKLILALSRLDDSDWEVLEKIALEMIKK